MDTSAEYSWTLRNATPVAPPSRDLRRRSSVRFQPPIELIDALDDGQCALPGQRVTRMRAISHGNRVDACVRRKVPHLYLGYYVAGCRSLEYKATFRPNQVIDSAGKWHDFLRE